MSVEATRRWKEKLAGLVVEAKKVRPTEARLFFLVKAIRGLETTGNRSLFLASGLKTLALRTMDSLGIDEKHIDRSFIRIDPTYKLPDGKAGHVIRKKLVKKFGARKVNDLVVVRTVPVPATTKTVYQLDAERFGLLTAEEKRRWAKIVGKRKVTVGDPPKRAKAGKPRRQKKG